ncbi:MAG TPA: alpha-L-glutamate ligase-like protein, partial [Pseudomonadales bacterium]|nr:alpha-L-glutamate ligase-like protein [Pseudomonadales bacterium]
VIKPANGSGGNGILVITGRRNDRFKKSNGELISLEQLKHHISNILSGMFSLGAKPDRALIEYRVKFDPFFAAVSYQGVPDIRIIVFRGIPVMAMARLPTAMSDGKANLHQGAVGVGIEIPTGKTLRGVWKNQLIDIHPDTENPLSGLIIPNWERLLHLAASCREIAKLDYIGCDFVLDEHLGPLMLELNARPGLSIQLSNRHGLEPRLDAVGRLETIPEDINARIELAKQICLNY